MKRICRMCGNEFEGSGHQRYCSTCKPKADKAQRDRDINRIKNNIEEHTCVICGKTFFAYTNPATCSPECTSQYRRLNRTGKKIDDRTKKKIGDKNCIEWHLISPEGKHFEFENLSKWAAENCDLFGFESNPKNATRISCGIAQAKMATMGLKNSPVTYKEWQVVIIYGPTEIVKLFKAGNSINRIGEISGLSHNKIRKVLIDKGLWENELSRKIKELRYEGASDKDIIEKLGITSKTLNNYSEYQKTIYNFKKTKNAKNISNYRKKIKDE